MKFDIGKKIQEVRKELGLSQAEVAKRLNTSLSNYTKFEKRENGISVGKLLEIAEAMRISPVRIMGYHEEVGLFEDVVLDEMHEEHIRNLNQEISSLKDKYDNLLGNYGRLFEKYLEEIILLNNKIRRQIYNSYSNVVKDNILEIDESVKDRYPIFSAIYDYIKRELFFIPLEKRNSGFMQIIQDAIEIYINKLSLTLIKETARFYNTNDEIEEELDWYRAKLRISK